MAFDYSSVKNKKRKDEKTSGFNYSSVVGKTERTEEEKREYVKQQSAQKRQSTNGRQQVTYAGKYNSAAGKAGYNNYLKSKEPKSDKVNFGNLFALAGYTAGSNTSAPNLAETAYGLRTDTSYKEPGDDWLDEEKNIFGYLWENDRTAAEKYATEVNNAINKYKKDLESKKVADYSTENFGQGILASASSIASNALSGADYLSDLVEYNARGVVTEKEDFLTPYEYTQAVRGSIASDLNEYGTIAGKGLGDLFQIGMSAADSFALGHLGIADPAFFGIGATAAMNEARERGVSENQAFAYGLTSGVMEAVFEHIGIDNMLKMKSPHTLSQAVKGVLKQSGVEALEEMGTELTNTAWDAIINMDKSEFVASYANYISEGKGRGEALARAFADLGGEVLWAGISGALSGTMTGTVQTGVAKTGEIFGDAVNKADARKAVKDLGKDRDAVLDYAMETEEGSEVREAAEDIKARTERGEKVSNKEYADVLLKTDNNFAKAEIKRQLETEATSIGEELSDEQLDSMSTAVLKTMRGEFISETENAQIEQSKTAKNVYARNMGVDYTYGEQLSKEKKAELKETRTQQVLFEAVKDHSEGYKQTLTKAYEDYAQSNESFEMDAEDFANEFSSFYDIGRAGVESVDRALEAYGKGNPQLTNALARAYELGKGENRAENIAQAEIKQQAAKKGVKGKIVFEGNVKNRIRNKQQAEAINFMANVLKDTTNMEYHIFASYEKNGERYYKDSNGDEIKAPNGFYDPDAHQIWIDVNAGSRGQGIMLYTLTHEHVHDIRVWSPEHYNNLLDIAVQTFEAEGMDFEKAAQDKYKSYIKNHPNYTMDAAREEVVADMMSGLLSNEKGLAEFSKQIQQKDASLWNRIKAWFKDVIARITKAYEDTLPESYEARMLMENKELFEKAQKVFAEAVVAAGENYRNAGVEIDTATESVAPSVMFSERTWSESEYVKARNETARAIASELDVSLDKAYDYIDSINSVAKAIADDRARLDYDPNLDEHATVLKPNSEYGVTVDMSTLCAKRLLTTGTFDAIQKKLPNMVFDSEDIVKLRKMMMDRGYEVACGICYVESTRREMGRITQEFIDRYKIAQQTGKPIARVNASGQEVVLKSQGKTFMAEKGYTPNLGELNTTEIDFVKRDHPEVYNAYLAFMNARGQAKPKLLETRAEYKGEILKQFKNKNAVDKKNLEGGLRLQSFSDFELPHLIDMMQIVMDMSRVGLKSQAYTKVPKFAEAFGDTGIKINLSLIAKGSGVDENGNLVFDDVEGINHEEAFRIRDKFSNNVGTILVGKSDEHIRAAMADPRIDMIIPFHKSSWKESLYEALGLTGYTDYTKYQMEKPGDKSKGKIEQFHSDEYWDYSKTGDENAQIYLQKCREDGRTPVFPQFQNEPGYWKMLIDFKMYDNDGVGAPHEEVKPIFDDDYNAKILNEYKGGHRKLPVAQDVVDDFVKEYSSEVKFQDRDSDGRELSEAQAEFFKGSQARDKKGRLLTLYHGTRGKFTEFNPAHSDDKISFFFTSNREVAHSYAPFDNTLDPYSFVDENSSLEELAKVIETDRRYVSVKAVDIKEAEKAIAEFKEKGNSIIKAMEHLLEITKGTRMANSFYMHSIRDNYSAFKKWIEEGIVPSYGNPLYTAGSKTNEILGVLKEGWDNPGEEVLNAMQELLDVAKPMQDKYDLAAAYNKEGTLEITDRFGKKSYLDKRQALKEANMTQSGGILPVYVNLVNPLILDAGGKNWNRIPVPPEMKETTDRTELRTRDVSEFAHSHGYDGVIFKNLVDMSQVSNVRARKSTVVVAFDSAQIKSVDNKTPTADPDIRYSERDSEYMEAVNAGDMKTAQKLVDEAAKEAGYDSPKLYHGTEQKGFTKIKTTGVEEGMDWSPFFATDSIKTAGTYSGTEQITSIGEMVDEDELFDAKWEALNKAEDHAINKMYRAEYLSEWQISKEYIHDIASEYARKLRYGYIQKDTVVETLYEELTDIVADAYMDNDDYEDFAEWQESPEGEKVAEALENIVSKVISYSTFLNENAGNYSLYANTENMLEVEGEGKYWNNIKSEYGNKTRIIAKNALEQGYNGVIIKNIIDEGIFGGDGNTSTVYIFFNPQSQVKSADPVTYDDNGNVIPLSERFKKENDDIRYSLRTTYNKEGMNEKDIETANKVISNLRWESMAARYGVVHTAAYTAERIERELNYSSANRPDYAKSYVAWVKPSDFVFATTVSEKNRENLKTEAGTLDVGRLSKESQPIYLIVDFENGRILGHEGRHRMLALEEAGIEKVAVIIDARNDDTYNTKPIERMRLEGQRFSDYEKGSNFSITSMLPLSARYADVAKEVFTQKTDSGIKFTNRNSNGVGAKYSLRPFYWEPTLDKDEWRIINYVVDNHQGVELTGKTDYFYRNYKGKILFGIYSTDDDTLLYAVHKNRAKKEYEFINFVREVVKNENINRGNADSLDKVLNNLGLRRNMHFNNNGAVAESRGYDGNAYVYFGAPRGKASRALQNVLENIFKERESSGDTGVKLQERLSAADQNRVVILEDQIKRLKADIKEIERHYEKAQDYARAEGILIGQVEQGKEMAKTIASRDAELRRKKESYERKAKNYEDMLEAKRAKIKEIRQRRDEILAERKAAFEAYREQRNESIRSGGTRKSIEKNAKTLMDWLLKNSDKEHVPEALKTTVGEFLETIDFTSKRGLAGGEPTKKDQAFAQKLNNLAAMLEKQRSYMNNANEGDAENPLDCFLDLPEGFAEEIRKLADDVAKTAIGGNFVINDMNSEQLAQLNKALRVLKTSISKMNKLITNAHFASVTEAARNSMLEMAEYKAHKPMNDISEQADKMLKWEMFTPVYAFKRYGSAGESIFRGIRNGWSDFAFAIDKVLKFTKGTYTDEEVEAWEKETHSIKLSDGKTVTLTTAQLMSLYCLNKREQARGHIYGGGIRIADIKKGKVKIQQTEPYLVSFEDVETLIAELSDRQIDVADKLQKFMTEQGSEWGNKVSMERFGYRAFTEENYFPIESDANNLIAIDPEAKANDMFRLLNMSATKSLTKGANNAIVISDIFDIFSNHMSDMAKYGSLALPILDTMKWYNYKVRYDVGDGQFRTETVQKSVERAYGKAGKSYFTNFMKDLNGVKEGGRGIGLVNKMVSNYKIASVGANLRVAVLQPTSIVRASMEIEPKYLLQALTKAPAAKKAESKSGVALWKSLGFYNTDIARGIRDQIKGGGKTIDKVRDKTMILAEKMDRITFGTLWNAAEAKAKDLGYSGEELDVKTTEIFDNIIYKTQVVDSTLTRSSLMRSTNEAVKSITAFMAEPTLSYNMVAETLYDMVKERDFSTGWQKNSERFGKAVAIYAASSIAAAVIESIPDAFRDDDDEEWFGQKWWQAFWGERFWDGNLLSEINVLEKIPLLKDFISVRKGYDIQRLDAAWMSSLNKAIDINTELYNVYVKGEKPTKTTYWGKMTAYGAAYANLRAISQIAGLPVSNTVRDVVAIWNTIVGGMAPSLKVKTYDDSKKK